MTATQTSGHLSRGWVVRLIVPEQHHHQLSEVRSADIHIASRAIPSHVYVLCNIHEK